MTRAPAKPWTREELQEFIRIYPTTSSLELMARFGRTYRAIACKAHDLQLVKTDAFRADMGRAAHLRAIGPRRPRQKKRWPLEVVQRLLEEYPHESNQALAQRYGCTERAVMCVAALHGVTKSAAYRTQAARYSAAFATRSKSHGA